MPAGTARRWTAKEVRRLIADAPLATPRYELVDGQLLVTPSPGTPHQMAVTRLSPSSARHDRITKRAGYQRHVPEYWIVDLDARLVERWRPGDERPEILSERLVWHPDGAAQPLELDLPPFFRRAHDE